MLTEQMFYIASLKHTDKGCEHITWWGKNYCGYTPVIGEYTGEYKLDDARDLNNGGDHIAVPVEIVKGLTSPEPYWKPGARFYDQRGHVVDNTRSNWNKLIESSLTDGRKEEPKPRIFRDKKRAIFTESSESLANQEKDKRIKQLEAALLAVSDDILRSDSIDVLWHSNIETTVDFISETLERDVTLDYQLKLELPAVQPSQSQVSDEVAKLIAWLLGEGEDFPTRPEKIEGKPHPLYWWRTELRKRWNALQSIPTDTKAGKVERSNIYDF